MSTKYSSWSSTKQPLATMTTDFLGTKLITETSDGQGQFKELDRVESSSHMHTNVNTSSSVSATNSLPSSEVQSGEKSSHEDTSTTVKPKPKHKCHHHHSGKHKCRHHQRRVKASKQQTQHLKRPSSPISLRKKSGNGVQNSREQPNTALRSALDNENSAVNTDTEHKLVHRNNHDQPASPSVAREAETQKIPKAAKGNIPLQSVENKMVSQRETTSNEMQVGNCSSCVYTQPPRLTINTGGVQQLEQVYYDDNCCLPQSTIGCATNSCSCIVQQPLSNLSVSQQQPFVCASGISSIGCFGSIPSACSSTSCACSTSNSYVSTSCVCSTGNSGFLQQISSPQQQILYVNNTSPATFVDQTSAYNPMSVNTLGSPTVCVSQAPLQSVGNIFIQQQPQILNQPLQQFQSSQAPAVQYIQMPSVAPQMMQMPTQAIGASPQILYQRPYDTLASPVQNQQLTMANMTGIPLSYPSYAPPRIISGTQLQQTAGGPQLFQQALVRTVANRTGTPVLTSSPMGPQLFQPPIPSPGMRGPLLSTASALPNSGIQRSVSVPIVPLTAGGLLIPFQPSEYPQGPTPKTVSRPVTNPSNLTNFNTIRRQIQDRDRVLADFRRQNANPRSAFPLPSANTGFRSRPTLPWSMPVPPPILSPNIRQPFSPFSSNIPQIPSALASNTPLSRPPPPVITSQTPYTSGNIFGSSSGSSSSSDRSSASSAIPSANAQSSSSGLIYSQPSFTGSRNESAASEPSPGYQPLRP